MRTFVKTLIIMVLTLSLFLVFCGKKEEAMDTSPEIPKGEPPVLVDSIPAVGPLRILSYGPTGESQGQVQIKIDFPRPLIPLTTLSDEQRRQILQYFKLDHEIKGDFRFLGTSTVVFEPTHSLPLASIYKVTVFRGLRDLEGYELQEDFSWEFKTLLPQITIQPSRTEPPVNIDQTIQINCNMALDLSTLEEKIIFQETVTQKGVDYRLLEHENNPDAEQDIGMGRVSYRYILKPKKNLKKNTTYTVIIQPGLLTARGNQPTERPVQANFKTFPPFEFITSKFCDGCGGNLLTQPYLSFTTRPAYKDLEKSINIDPVLAENPFYTYACGSSNNIGINDYLLTPNSTYSVTLNAELKDIYGQNLDNPQTITFTTGEFTPKMWGPAGYQLITPNIEPRLGIKTIKITSAFYRLLTLKPDQILVRENLNYYYSIKKLLDNIPGSPERIDISLNESDVGKHLFDLQPYLSGENYGVVAYTFRSPQVQCYNKPIEFNGLILRTNIGIYAQLHPTAGIIKINQLTDGAPIAGARIKIYREDDLPQLDKIWDLIRGTIPEKPQPCFSGVSDANGLLFFEGKEVAACTKRRISNKVLNELYPPEADPDDINYDRERFGFADPPRLLIIAEKGDDWTFLQTQTYGNPSIWQFGVITDWESERPISRGTLFSDHYIYRPGDTVKMKGISRYLLFGKMFSGKGNQYTIKLRDPMGAEKELGKVKVSDFGTFNIDIPTREGQSLGYYQVVAETPYKGLRFYGEFRLAEFRVPEFKVTLQADKKIAVAGESIDLDWEGKYYFGGPMAKASSSLNITRRKTYFKPAGWETYTFGVPDYLEERQVSLSGTFLKETIELNASGLGEKSVRFREDDVPFPMTYRFDVEVEDVSRQTIAANQSSTLLPDERLIGLNVSNWIVAADDTVDLSVIVSSPQGKLLEKIPVTVKLMKREYHSVKTETPDGRFTTEHNVVTKTVESKEVNSGNQPVPVMFIPPEAGSYVIRAELKKKPDSGTAAATSLWVSGRDYVPWEDRGEDRLEMIMDKKEYEIGDQATVFIKSPFPKAELLISTGREKIFQKEILKIEGSAYTYTFQITEDMLPNAYVTAALFRIGDPIVPVEEEVGKHMERIGITAFQVSSDSKYLSVKVTPDRLKARPAEEITVQLQVKNASGAGHRSEITVIVVDEAVLALTGYSPPDLVKTVYTFRGYSGRINDNRPFIITEEQLLQKGTGYGGGMLGGVADPRVRKEFLKLAHYQPSLITDKDGKALFTFKLPDNLTTWRIMAVAVGEKDLFGYGEEKLVSTQPFILRAILPRFARIGDQFLSGVAITNLTEAAGQVSVESTIEGKSVIAGGRKAKQTGIRIKPGESKAILFPFQAGLTGESQLKFTAFFQGVYDGQTILESDALQVPLDIQEPLVTETVVSAGETTDNFTQQIKVDESVRRDVGGLQMLVSSTALTNIGEGAKYLVEYPYGCLEQTSSRLLALLQLKFLSEKYQFTLQAVKPVEKVIQANIRKILLLQNFDGGFKFWPNSDRSNCYLTPYVAYLISRSQQLGYEFPEPVKKNLKNYLDQILRNPCYPLGSWKALAEYRLNILRGLYALGNLDETYFEEYYNRRNDLSIGAQIQLAYLLAQSSRWKPEAGKILTELKNAVFTTAQTAYFESPRSLPPSWLFMYSPIITTADGIKLFLELEPDSPYITKFSRYILNARRNGRWRNTFENAHAIDALVEISQKREAIPPDYTAAIQLAGEEVLKHLFKGYQYQPLEEKIPLAELPAGLNDIVVSKKGKGILYYTLSYSYRLKGPQPARHEGFSIKRTVRNPEKDRDLVTYGDEPQDRLEVKAGDILEVVLEFKVPQTGYHLVIDDPIPAGLEAIDASLKTTSARYDAPSQQRQSRGRSDARGYSWSPINHTELRDERVALFAEAIQPGNYTYRYMLRATTAGTFLWPAAKISLMYEPEQFGTCSEGFVEVEE